MQSSDKGGKPALSRRAFVGRLAAGAAVASAVSLTIGEARALTRGTKTSRGAGNDNFQPAAVPSAPGAGEPAVSAPVVGPSAAEVSAVSAASPPASAPPPPWELLRPLAVGSVVAHGWRVAELSGVADGSLVLTLENERGRAHRVHLCRNDGRPQGLVYTKRFDLVVMNGGQGDLPTEEGLAQAVAEVAHVLAANESDRQQEPVVAALLPHAERVQLFAAAAALR
jgi:hypothetical protein